MKKINITIVLSLLFCIDIISQNHQISLSSGYTNQSFYSMQNGEVSNVLNDNWDISFSTDVFSSTIRINDGKGVQLYTYHLADTSGWTDTINYNTLLSAMHNSDTSWDIGAFDINQTNGFDYGWGVYNLQTHNIVGDSLFVIQTVGGNKKKLWIERKVSGEYQFKYSNLDGSNPILKNIAASNYSDKKFIYYSIDQDLVLDREPKLSEWDITFTKYITPVQGMPYSVTGVLNNYGVEIAKADNIQSPQSYNDYSAHSFKQKINTIGYDWKYYDFASSSYLLDQNTCFFIKDNDNNIWKIIFTKFEGTNSGNIEFNTQLISSTNLKEIDNISTLGVYPNPAMSNQVITLVYDIPSKNKKLQIFDLKGEEVYSNEITSNGLNTLNIPSNYLAKGIYIVSININGQKLTNRLIIN